MVCDIKGIKQTRHVSEKVAEENIWTWQEESDRRRQHNKHEEHDLHCSPGVTMQWQPSCGECLSRTRDTLVQGESINDVNLHFSQTYISIMHSRTRYCITVCLNKFPLFYARLHTVASNTLPPFLCTAAIRKITVTLFVKRIIFWRLTHRLCVCVWVLFLFLTIWFFLTKPVYHW
jgi:hypothetical protein